MLLGGLRYAFAHTVKPGYIFLVIGGALIASGLIVSAFSVSTVVRQFPQESLDSKPVPLAPGQAFVHESVEVPAGRQYVVSITFEPADVPLAAQVRDSDGALVQSYDVTASPFFATAGAPREGSLSLEVRNAGDRPVEVAAGLLGMPFEERELVNFGVAILAGAGLVIAGIAVAIVGAVKVVQERRVRRRRGNISSPA